MNGAAQSNHCLKSNRFYTVAGRRFSLSRLKSLHIFLCFCILHFSDSKSVFPMEEQKIPLSRLPVFTDPTKTPTKILGQGEKFKQECEVLKGMQASAVAAGCWVDNFSLVK